MEKFTIQYESLDFPCNKKELCGVNSIEFTWGALIWAAVTIGRSSWSDIKNVEGFEKEIIYRKALLDMAITKKYKDPNSSEYRLYMSSVVVEMDPSEKAGINYSLGMTFSKLFSSKLLKTHWLMHLDKYEKSLAPSFINKGSSLSKTIRPDLIGIMADKIKDDQGKWCIKNKHLAMEVKGRSERNISVLNTAINNQLKNLSAINGSTPFKVAFMSYFTKVAKELKVIWKDPEFVGINTAHSLVIDDQRFKQVYYENFIKLIYQDSYETINFGKMTFHVVKLSDNFIIGLNESISHYDASKNSRVLNEFSLNDLNLNRLNEEEIIKGMNYYLGEDGVLVGYRQDSSFHKPWKITSQGKKQF